MSGWPRLVCWLTENISLGEGGRRLGISGIVIIRLLLLLYVTSHLTVSTSADQISSSYFLSPTPRCRLPHLHATLCLSPCFTPINYHPLFFGIRQSLLKPRHGPPLDATSHRARFARPQDPCRSTVRIQTSIHMLRLRPTFRYLNPHCRSGQDRPSTLLYRTERCLLRLSSMCDR